MVYALALIGAVVLYLGWNISLTSWSRLRELGVEHSKNSFTFFDTIFNASVLSLVISRIVWMIQHAAHYAEVPWGILPYTRSEITFEWFSTFPWRLLRVPEGLNYVVLWSALAFIVTVFLYVPTLRLARKLKTEKRTVMRSFMVRSLTVISVTISYFAVLVFLSL
jgi:hypothetical protein